MILIRHIFIIFFLQPTLFNTHGGTVDGAAGTTCVPGTTPSSTPSTGVAYQEAETTKTTTTGAQATCGQEFFSKVEDRPRVIERKASFFPAAPPLFCSVTWFLQIY